MSSTPVCASIGTATCLDRATIGIPAPGYYCKQDVCIQCPVGTYGTDGHTCLPCPYATWSPSIGSSSCGTSFTYSKPGLQKSYIPFGVTEIVVKVWGGGGGSDTSLDPTGFVSHSGGSGGFASCNLTVHHSRNVYVIVGGGGGSKALTFNLGGYGGGGRGYAVSGISSGGGGGRSAVQLVLGTDSVTAGGGGGGSDCLKTKSCGGGAGGGAAGSQAADTANGRGATATKGGAAGAGLYCNGTAGTQYSGGNGCRYLNTASTAGGGGGYYGGGGGSAYGANNHTHTPTIYETDGGGGGGSSYGGGCKLGSYFTLPGNNGNTLDFSRSGGMMQAQYVPGVGIGGAGASGGGNAGGPGYVTITFVTNMTMMAKSAMPSSRPSSAPTGQPTGQPTTGPTVLPIFEFQPTSKPTGAAANPLFGAIGGGSSQDRTLNGMSTMTAIIVFSCVGAVILCLFIIFTCYFHDKYHNSKEEDKLHNLVEEHYNEDEVMLDDGEGGNVISHESGYYRQFGENDNPIHGIRDKDGNIIPGSARAPGSLTRQNTILAEQNNKSFTKKQSFVLRDNRRGKLVNRTSVSTMGNGSMNGDSVGDMTARSNASSHSMHSRSSNQIVSQVRVQSYSGTGPPPRLIRMVNTPGPVDAANRARYISEHQDDVLEMQKFFRQAGLTQVKAKACAEEAICLDANNPKKLFKYTHEVSGFNLTNLGMDEIDADMVNEHLNSQYSHKDLNAGAAAKSTADKVLGAPMTNSPGTSTTSRSGTNSPGGHSTSTTTTINTINNNTIVHAPTTPEEIAKAKVAAEHDHDIKDMTDFFRFSGLSVKISKHCAEQAVAMDANSPKKLLKYLEDVKGFVLTDLGMDHVDEDMVLKTLKREYGNAPAKKQLVEEFGTKKVEIVKTTSAPIPNARHDSIDVDLDMRDDSSDDGDDTMTSHRNNNNRSIHSIKNDQYTDGPSSPTKSPIKTDTTGVHEREPSLQLLEEMNKSRKMTSEKSVPLRLGRSPSPTPINKF